MIYTARLSMNIEKYKRIIGDGKLLQRGEEFSVLGLLARLDYFTESSAGFSISDVIGAVHNVKGHLDIHHPCPKHIKAYLTCSLPEEHTTFESARKAVEQIFQALEIPLDETYEAHFMQSTRGIQLSEHVDRDGMTNVMVTRKQKKQ